VLTSHPRLLRAVRKRLVGSFRRLCEGTPDATKTDRDSFMVLGGILYLFIVRAFRGFWF